MSRILKEMHELAMSLHKAGAIDQVIMRQFDVLCVPAVRKHSPKKKQRNFTRSLKRRVL